MAGFYSARASIMPPLPWPTFAPPLSMAGVTMAWQYREDLARPLDSSFATLLSIKIALAASVLAHFITAVILGARGKLRSRHTKVIHLSVFFHVVLIVFLAKAMFYISW